MKHKKFSIRAAQKAFNGFGIREIIHYKSHDPKEIMKYDVVIILGAIGTLTTFEYKSVEYIRLNDYQKDLHDFIMSLPKLPLWFESEYEWKDGEYVRNVINAGWGN